MYKITLTVLVPETEGEQVRQALQAAVNRLQLCASPLLTVARVSGPVEPNQWLDTGPDVQVRGIWKFQVRPDPRVDYYEERVLMVLEIGGCQVHLLGYPTDDSSVPPGYEWELPTGLGKLLGCEEELARELVEALAYQVLDEFAVMPVPPGQAGVPWPLVQQVLE